MQKLRERREIDAPADVPQVCSPAALRRSDTDDRTTYGKVYGSALNSPKREGDSVVSLTTSLNSPDAAHTHRKVEKGGLLC